MTELPKNKKSIRATWVFVLKTDGNRIIARHKGGLVAKVYSKIYGVEYYEVFITVTKLTTVRFSLSSAAAQDMKIEKIEIKTAFLNGELKEEIYLEPPTLPLEIQKLFNIFSWKRKVWRLLKSIYDLKQASRIFRIKFHKLTVQLKFTKICRRPMPLLQRNRGLLLWYYCICERCSDCMEDPKGVQEG